MEKKGQGCGHKKAHFINSRQTHTHMVSGSPGTPMAAIPRGFLLQGSWLSLGRAPHYVPHLSPETVTHTDTRDRGIDGRTGGRDGTVNI